VRHLSEGTLRRLYDEPYAVEDTARSHYRSCQRCQRRFRAVADDARHAQATMAATPVPVDAHTALGRVRSRLGERERPRFVPLWGLGWRRPALAGATAAILAAGLSVTAFTPLGSDLVNIFQPTRESTVTIAQGDLTGLDAFSSWGTVTWAARPELQQVDSAAQAAQLSGLPAIRVSPGTLPASVAGAPVSYAAMRQATGTVTFTSKAPAQLQGSTLQVRLGPAETVVYGDLGKVGAAAHGAGTANGATENGIPAQGGSDESLSQGRGALRAAGPLLGIVVMDAPRASSTGVSVAQIKQALLAQPGLSPAVRQYISSLDDPAGNLPIPIPAGQVNAHPVRVQGVTGTAIGDNTGLGSGVVWIAKGKVYAVAGTLTEDQVLAIANGLGA
jgi:hypothetical protein